MPLLVVALAAVMQAAPAVTSIARDSMSGIEDTRQVVVQSSDEWARLWRVHAPERPVPAINFNSRTVIAVFLGTRSSAGYAVEVVRTRRDGDGLVVEWSERRPKADEVAAQVLTSPSHIVTIPKFAGNIRFEKVQP